MALHHDIVLYHIYIILLLYNMSVLLFAAVSAIISFPAQSDQFENLKYCQFMY